MSIRTTAILTAVVLGLAACDGGGAGRPLPPPPGPPVPQATPAVGPPIRDSAVCRSTFHVQD